VQRAQQGIRGGQYVDHRDEQVVGLGQVGPLVGQQRPPFGRRQAGQHRRRHHDPARPAGQRVRQWTVVAQHHQLAAVRALAGHPVGVDDGPDPAHPRRDRQHREHQQQHARRQVDRQVHGVQVPDLGR
jgi:hypothetical protein